MALRAAGKSNRRVRDLHLQPAASLNDGKADLDLFTVGHLSDAGDRDREVGVPAATGNLVLGSRADFHRAARARWWGKRPFCH